MPSVASLHIALCHDAVIPPRTYGGTERIIAWLAKALCTLGHRVTLLAREGTDIPGCRFIPLKPNVPIDDLLPADVDVAHLWATPNRRLRLPFIVTIEGNGAKDEVFHPNTVFISRRHAENHGSLHFVYNGLNPDDFTCSTERDDYVVFLAKASLKVKNLEGAIRVARAAGLNLEVMGSRSWPLEIQRLLPRLRGVRYHGMVGDAQKRKLLSRARALLFPVRWHEPFGIAVVEALLSGCPILATPYGSLPELISPNVGALSTSGLELARVLRAPNKFDPLAIRSYAIERFSHLRMAHDYLRYYRNVLSEGQIAPGSDVPRMTLEAKALLPWQHPIARLV